jgi:hypothetical protein
MSKYVKADDEEILRRRKFLAKNARGGGSNQAKKYDERADQMPEDAPKDEDKGLGGAGAGTKAAVEKHAAGGNMASSAGSGMMAAGAATANPYLIAGGATLSVLGARRDRIDKQAMDQYNADEARKKRVADILAGMSANAANIGIA